MRLQGNGVVLAPGFSSVYVGKHPIAPFWEWLFRPLKDELRNAAVPTAQRRFILMAEIAVMLLDPDRMCWFDRDERQAIQGEPGDDKKLANLASEILDRRPWYVAWPRSRPAFR